ncbi:MAG TPA: hypothetical protein VGP82_16730 [Ktedonobacterales bacterium]|jgi:hypothetical protein|nr:hypothetical protein [Ktedonobacterales bacterium]
MKFVGWYPFEQRSTIGETGSESGIILRDEEYSACARITLERDGHTPFAITCGIYGWMVHTRFFSTEQEANEAFGAMKVALARIVDLIPSRADPQANERSSGAAEEMHAFIEEFP